MGWHLAIEFLWRQKKKKNFIFETHHTALYQAEGKINQHNLGKIFNCLFWLLEFDLTLQQNTHF